MPQQCLGLKKDGARCRQIVHKKGADPYCFQHETQRPLGERFLLLRELLGNPPSEQIWEGLLSLFGKWPDDAERSAALIYANAHMERWPHHLRTIHGFQTRHAAWPLVRHLQFVDSKMPDSSDLELHPQIEELGFHWQDPGQLDELIKHRNTSTLTLNKCYNLRHLRSLRNLDKLIRLHLYCCRNLITLKSFSFFKRLQEIGIWGTWYLDDVTELSSLPELSSLTLAESRSEYLPKGLSSLSRLRSLDLHGSHLERIAEGFFSDLHHLEELNLSGCFRLLKLDGIAGLSSLKKLDISGCMLMNIDALSTLTSLETLHLSPSNVTKVGIHGRFPTKMEGRELIAEYQASLKSGRP